MCALLILSGKKPSLNMSLNDRLNGNDIGVAIRGKTIYQGLHNLTGLNFFIDLIIFESSIGLV